MSHPFAGGLPLRHIASKAYFNCSMKVTTNQGDVTAVLRTSYCFHFVYRLLDQKVTSPNGEHTCDTKWQRGRICIRLANKLENRTYYFACLTQFNLPLSLPCQGRSKQIAQSLDSSLRNGIRTQARREGMCGTINSFVVSAFGRQRFCLKYTGIL